MKSRRLANEKVGCLRMSGFQYSRAVKMAQLRLRLSNILTKRKEDNSKIKLKTVCKLAKIAGSNWWISLDVAVLIHQITKSKREYYKLKRASGAIRATYLEQRAKEAAQLVNIQEESKLHTLLTTEKSKDRARRPRFLKPIQKGAGVS